MMTNLWKFPLLVILTGLFALSSFGCAGSHVGVGVAVPGSWYGYPGPYGGPPVWVGRPYPGYC